MTQAVCVPYRYDTMPPTGKPRSKKPPPTPKQSRPWDIPPLPAKGDAKSEITLAAVGLALSQWEYLEGLPREGNVRGGD